MRRELILAVAFAGAVLALYVALKAVQGPARDPDEVEVDDA